MIFLAAVAIAARALYPADPRFAYAFDAKPYEDPEAYRVYSAILPRFVGHPDERATLFIKDHTVSYPSKCLAPGASVKNLFRPAIKDYERVNRSSWELARHFELEKPYELVGEEDYERRSSKAEFPYFIEISAVGFNPSKTIAVVYLANYCRGSYCLARDLIVLRKEGERWRDLHDRGLFCWWRI